MRITLKDEVWEEGVFAYHDGEEVRVKYRFKGKLVARQCDCCGKVYGVPKGQNGAGTLLDASINLKMDEYHPNHTDSFWLDICSVECGLKLADGAWKQAMHDPMDPDGRHPFVAIGATCANYKLNARSDLISKADLLEKWEASGAKPPLSTGDARLTSYRAPISISGGHGSAKIERTN